MKYIYYYFIHNNYYTYIFSSMEFNELNNKIPILSECINELQIPNIYKNKIINLYHCVNYHFIIDNSYSTTNRINRDSNDTTSIYQEIKNITLEVINISKLLEKDNVDIVFSNDHEDPISDQKDPISDQKDPISIENPNYLNSLFKKYEPKKNYTRSLTNKLKNLTNNITKMEKITHYIVILTDGVNSKDNDFNNQLYETIANENIYVMFVVVNKKKKVLLEYKWIFIPDRMRIKFCYEYENKHSNLKKYTNHCYYVEIATAAYNDEISTVAYYTDFDNNNNQYIIKLLIIFLMLIFVYTYIHNCNELYLRTKLPHHKYNKWNL